MRRYPAYKDSGVEWLGEVPEGWRIVPVKAVATCNDEVLPEDTDPDWEIEYLEISGVDAVAGITETSTVTFDTAASRARRKLRDGDVLVSTVRTYLRAIAQVVAPPTNMIASTGFAVLRPRGVASRFLGYLFRSEVMISKIIARSVGVSYPAINASEIMSLHLPLPPLPEQTAIAAFLDRETAKIDALVAEQRRLIDLLREKRQAVISHAVTKGLNPNAPLKPSGIDWLGDVPEGWEVLPLKRVTLERCDGPFGSGLKSEHYVEAGMRVVRLQNIKADGFSDDDAAFIDLDYASSELSRHTVLAGDVLIAGLGDERNLVGRACVAPVGIEPAMVKADCFRFRLNTSRAASDFVALQLNVSAAFDAGTKATGTTRSRIPLSQMAERALALPPLAEQHEIDGHVQRVSYGFDTLTATAETAIALLQERRAALISAAVTGKIDVRHLVQKEDEAA